MPLEIIKTTLNSSNPSEKELLEHYHKLKVAYPDNTGASIVKMLLRYHFELSKVYGLRFDWKDITEAPAYMQQILDAVKGIKVAGTVLENEADGHSVEFGEGLFDE